MMIKNKELFKNIVIPFSILSLLFLPILYTFDDSVVPYFGFAWGCIGAMIFIVGSIRARALSSGKTTDRIYQVLLVLGILYLLFAGGLFITLLMNRM